MLHAPLDVLATALKIAQNRLILAEQHSLSNVHSKLAAQGGHAEATAGGVQHVCMFDYASGARAWTVQASWYMPYVKAVCVVCYEFATYGYASLALFAKSCSIDMLYTSATKGQQNLASSKTKANMYSYYVYQQAFSQYIALHSNHHFKLGASQYYKEYIFFHTSKDTYRLFYYLITL